MTDHEPIDRGVPSFAKPGAAAPAPPPAWGRHGTWPPGRPPAWGPVGPPPSGPANPWGAQQSQGYGGYPAAAAPTRALSGLGIATQIMLGIQMLATVSLFIPVLHQRSLIDKLRSDPTSVSPADADRADNMVSSLSTAVSVLFIATGIVWIIWFYRARINADAWSQGFQRRGRAWAIWAWVCPVVSLWFPYMISRDILDDTEGGKDGSRVARRSRPLLMTWWLAFVALSVIALLERSHQNPHTLADVTTYSNIEIASVAAHLVAGVLAVLVVRQITGAQTRRMSGTVAR